MQTATADPLVGRTLEGRYEIIDRIARGGMSTVYEALDRRLDRRVAVKVMSAALSTDPAFTDRFSREARAAARLSHPNVVSVFDQGTDISTAGHHVFLVMELVPGHTLRALLRERGQLSQAETLAVMEQVLSALAAAHRAGVVHRDIKPENILISDAGVVKVADFGLARAVETDSASTRTGLMMGTVAYCPPEQISKGRADQRSDVYSAGIVAFELLTGKPPFTGDSAMTVAYQHVHDRVPAPSTRARNIAPRVDELVLGATSNDPAGRPLDAGAFLAQLRDVREDLGMTGVAVPTPARADEDDGEPEQRPRLAAPPLPPAPPARPTGPITGAQPTDRLQGGPARHDTFVVNGHGPAALGAPPPPVRVTPVRTASQRMTPPPQAGRPARFRRRRRAIIVVLILLLLGAAAGYGGWWLVSGRFSSIPNVGGLNQAAAVTQLKDAGYRVATTPQSSFSETVPKGAIVRTDPASGTRLQRGKSVTLVVSLGPERFTVPAVAVRGSPAAAQSALAAIPVHVVTRTESNDTVPKGTVIGTDPAANTRVKRDSTVTLLVSSGPPVLPIPAITPGTPYDTAAQALQQHGFKVARTDAFNTSIPAGDVISVSPTGSAVKFSTITLTVSKGPPTVTIPAIAELTPVSQAKAKLTALGLQVAIQSAFGGNAGLVVGMDPKAGTVVTVGSTVTLTVV